MFTKLLGRKWLKTTLTGLFLLGLITGIQGSSSASHARGVESYPAYKFNPNKKRAKRKFVKNRKQRKARSNRAKGKKSFSGRAKSRKVALRRPASRHAHKVTKQIAGSGRLHPRLRRLLARVRTHYGRPLIISSGCRSHRHNRRVGGARRSMHLRCMAADFKVVGVSKGALRRYVASLSGRGGVGTYCGRSIVHLDVGPRRSWYYGCRKSRRKNRRRRG